MKISRPGRKTITAVATVLATFMTVMGVAYAATDHSVVRGNTDHTIYKFGREITITGQVDGDIYCAGQTVVIDAEVNGDVLCAGQTVTVNGDVAGNVRAAGQTINLGGQVGVNASLAGNSVTVNEKATIGRDLSATADTMIVNGSVGRDLDAAGNKLTIDTTVGRHVDAAVGNELLLGSSARISGNLNYHGVNDNLQQAGAAQVVGKVTYHKEEVKDDGWAAFWRVYFMVAKIVVAVVLVALLPQVFRRWHGLARQRWGAALLTGFIAMFAWPLAALALLATVFGAPLGILLILLWLVALFPSAVLAMYTVGHLIGPKLHPLLIALLGALALGLLEMLPWVGGIVLMLAYWFGTGAFLLNVRQAYKKPNFSAKAPK